MEDSLPLEKSKKSQGKRKASFASESATKRPKWPWTSKAVEIILKYSRFGLDVFGLDVNFEADLFAMYKEIRRCMAVDFSKILALILFTNREKNSMI